MGKKIQINGNEQTQHNDEHVSKGQANKKPLRQFLPYSKYMIVRAKNYKKKLSNAIKGISLDKLQVKKAVECLYKYAEQHENLADLSGKQQIVYLSIDVSRIPENHSVKPIQIKLPHPIYSSQAKSRYSIIISDQSEQKFVDLVDNLNVPMLRQIISYQKIKKNFKQLKDKRELIAANDLFFCDWKVYNLLRQPLGKIFYEEKRFPFPIECQGEVPQHLKQQYSTYEAYLNGLANYTYTMLGNGPVYTIKVAKTKMGIRQSVKNIMHASYSLIANILENKINPQHIRQISIKTYNSPSLPIYNFLSEEEIKCFKQQN